MSAWFRSIRYTHAARRLCEAACAAWGRILVRRSRRGYVMHRRRTARRLIPTFTHFAASCPSPDPHPTPFFLNGDFCAIIVGQGEGGGEAGDGGGETRQFAALSVWGW